jgi:sulfur carrier protein
VKVQLNGEETEVQDGATVRTLLAHFQLPAGDRGVAVAIDREVVPRGGWETHEVPAGAHVEIVNAIQGG